MFCVAASAAATATAVVVVLDVPVLENRGEGVDLKLGGLFCFVFG